MRVLVVGAYGLIGTYVVARLLADGDEVVGAGRDIAAARRRMPAVRWVRAELGRTSAADWVALLAGVDGVVNCAGALQDSPRDDLRAVHVDGVRTLAEACRVAGVARFVHVSAAGVAEGRPTPFNRTKLEAEAMLQSAPLDWIILRPGVVLAPAAYGGTALLRGLAGFPFVLPVVHAASIVQVVSVEDVAAAAVRALASDAPTRIAVDLVHGERHRIADIAREMRRWLGIAEAPVLALPAAVARATAMVGDALAWLGWRSPMRSAALAQVRLGVTGDSDAARRLLGLELRSLRATLDRWPAGVQERWFARAYFLKPAMLATLSVFWFLSGAIGLCASRPAAVSILADAGIAAHWSEGAVVAGALADIGLAVAVAFRNVAGRALQGMLLVSLAYLAGGTLLRPDLWLDPLGPFLKVIPAAVLALAALALLDER
ncbi:MAG: SDR family oxidoreductase [Alphaproteobacteria bacterium]|nr:SDR family oxidoreductase [Alphaproteobacteria bacterium]